MNELQNAMSDVVEAGALAIAVSDDTIMIQYNMNRCMMRAPSESSIRFATNVVQGTKTPMCIVTTSLFADARNRSVHMVNLMNTILSAINHYSPVKISAGKLVTHATPGIPDANVTGFLAYAIGFPSGTLALHFDVAHITSMICASNELESLHVKDAISRVVVRDQRTVASSLKRQRTSSLTQ